jgi:hypothetical protein
LFGNLGGGHLCLRQYQTVFSKREFSDYFKTSFVRNPWDRLVSAFFFLKEGGLGEWDRQWAEKHLADYSDFNSFVKGFVNPRSVRSAFHFSPQYKYICGVGGRIQVDFVGFFENLQEDVRYIQSRIGSCCRLEHHNKTRTRVPDYQQYYTPETAQIVANAYREDVRIFGYEFDNSSLQRQLARRARLRQE